MARDSNWMFGVNIVLVMAYGSLVFVLLFIFVKRQNIRFAMKSRRGPHVPVGHNAPKNLKEDTDILLSRIQDIMYEPHLPADDDAKLQLESQENQSCYNYLYKLWMLSILLRSHFMLNFYSYLLDLQNTSTLFSRVCGRYLSIPCWMDMR
uniref:Uncharacterized protein n=2 Tax=Marmota marmota marmota TaxID=9994 RepID=A0A8C6A825_MARMA